MSEVILMAGLGIVGFLLAYLFFNFGKDEISQKHYLLRLLLIGCLFGVFVLIGKVGLDSSVTCDLLPSKSFENSTVITFEYERVCFDNTDSNTGLTFYRLTLWIVRLISAYILVYLFYEIFMYFNRMIRGKRGRSKDD